MHQRNHYMCRETHGHDIVINGLKVDSYTTIFEVFAKDWSSSICTAVLVGDT